jgi:Protein of unknwon function (DUF3310)
MDNIEKINHPEHYGGENNPYEAIKVIDAWELNFSLGNAVKYISRAGKKHEGNKLEDLKKAAWYLENEIKKHTVDKQAPQIEKIKPLIFGNTNPNEKVELFLKSNQKQYSFDWYFNPYDYQNLIPIIYQRAIEVFREKTGHKDACFSGILKIIRLSSNAEMHRLIGDVSF